MNNIPTIPSDIKTPDTEALEVINIHDVVAEVKQTGRVLMNYLQSEKAVIQKLFEESSKKVLDVFLEAYNLELFVEFFYDQVAIGDSNASLVDKFSKEAFLSMKRLREEFKQFKLAITAKNKTEAAKYLSSMRNILQTSNPFSDISKLVTYDENLNENSVIDMNSESYRRDLGFLLEGIKSNVQKAEQLEI